MERESDKGVGGVVCQARRKAPENKSQQQVRFLQPFEDLCYYEGNWVGGEVRMSSINPSSHFSNLIKRWVSSVRLFSKLS